MHGRIHVKSPQDMIMATFTNIRRTGTGTGTLKRFCLIPVPVLNIFNHSGYKEFKTAILARAVETGGS